MKTDRVASFGSHDRKLASHLKRKEARAKNEEERQMRAEEESKSCTSTISSISAITSSEGSSSEVECDSPFKIPQQTPVKVHHRETRTGTAAFIPHDKSPKVVSLATRMKFSPLSRLHSPRP